jgi:hypothetical protein
VRPRLLDLHVSCIEHADGWSMLIDTADLPLVADRTIYLGDNGYAYYSTWSDGRSTPHLVHHLILPARAGRHVDHRNGDKLDNARANLRYVTYQANQVNRRTLNRNNTSGVRGVGYVPKLSPLRPWRAQIMVNRRMIHLGLFESKDEAIAARRAAELDHFGEECPR